MTSIGYGDILPQTLTEYTVNSICMVISGIMWAYIIGVASSILSNSYPEVKEFEQRMDAFNTMVKEMQVPAKIRLRGREFIRESRYKTSHERNLKVIQTLGFDLQAHISKESAELYFSNIRLFSGCSELFCADCAAQMLPHFYEPHYVIKQHGHLFIVEKGAIGHQGRVLVPFNHWGEDFIVTNTQLKTQSPAIALNYALVVSLSCTSLESVLTMHPQERLHFRRRAICMAFKSAMRIYFDDLSTLEIPPEHKWIHALVTQKTPQSSDQVAALCTPGLTSKLITLPKFDDNRQRPVRDVSLSKQSTTTPSDQSLFWSAPPKLESK